MMQERTKRTGQQAKKQATRLLRHPKRREIFFHFIKTGKLVKRLLGDRRVPVLRKVAFGGLAAFLIALLLIPDTEVFLGTLLPIIGTVLGIPLDAGLDWTVFALFATNMLRLFPQEFVTEHYENIFHDGKKVYIDAEEWGQLR